ncbi:MAG: serine acetyltransferase [Austwickia sp.]|nr:serine acetyltransferase [Austwickia sp.]
MSTPAFPPSPHHPRDLRSARAGYRRLLAADYARDQFLFERITLAIFRAGQALRYVDTPVGRWLRRFVLVLDLAWTQALMGAELPHEVWAGPGLKLHHGGRGIILHPSVVIGENVRIYHNVTVGVRDGRPAARIGDRAFLGTGATILGPVTIGADSKVGAHAVVLTDTEPGATYVGVPAAPASPAGTRATRP